MCICYVVTGSTPHKPSEKKAREQEPAEQLIQERPARRTLAFRGKGSPSQKVIAD